MKLSVPLARVFGIPIRANISWFLTFGFITFFLAVDVYPEWLPDASTPNHWLLALVSGILFFVSIVLHELAHSLVARAYGIPVKEITLFFLGGVAHLAREATRPFADFAMAAAGPAASLVLAGLLLLVWWAAGFSDDGPLPVMWQFLLFMNLSVGVFNMAPGFPMDGGRILRAILWGAGGDYRRATFLASWCGRIMAYGMVFLGLAAAVDFVNWLSPATGLWLVLLGFFLENAARSSWLQVRTVEFLRDHKTVDLMSEELHAIGGDMRLCDLADNCSSALKKGQIFFVTEDGRVSGIIGLDQLKAVPRDRWPTTTASAAATPVADVKVVGPNTDVAMVLQTLEENGLRQMPVVEDGHLVGVVSRDSIVRLLITKRILR